MTNLMMQSVEFLLKWVVPERAEQHSPKVGRIRLLITLCLLGLLISLLYCIFFIIIGFYLGIWLNLLVPFAIALILYFLKYKASLSISANLTLVGVQLSVLGIALLSGDSASPMLVWLLMPPVLSAFLQNRSASAIWLIISILNLLLIYLLDLWGYALPIFPGIWQDEFQVLSLFSLLIFMLTLIWSFQAHQQLIQDKLSEAHSALAERNHAVEQSNKHLAQKHRELARKNEEISNMTNQLEDIVAERTESLRKVNEELDIFLYRSSHDLRRPLTSLLGLFEVMRLEEDNNPHISLMLDKASNVVHDMDNMLRKLIMISDVYGENSPYSAINFNQMFSELHHQFKKTLAQTNVALNVQYPRHQQFFSNKNLLEIILYNLIENALHFQQPMQEKPHRKINITIEHHRERFKLVVQDEGIGIPEEEVNKIFKLFYKAHHHHNIGHGLGLYIVKKAIEQLEGEIITESQIGEGSTFRISLPNRYQQGFKG